MTLLATLFILGTEGVMVIDIGKYGYFQRSFQLTLVGFPLVSLAGQKLNHIYEVSYRLVQSIDLKINNMQ